MRAIREMRSGLEALSGAGFWDFLPCFCLAKRCKSCLAWVLRFGDRAKLRDFSGVLLFLPPAL
ncbi:MAG: hypothetical protein AAGA60_18530 [Cyanobacteria bacterium P01_E01_bin.42]